MNDGGESEQPSWETVAAGVSPAELGVPEIDPEVTWRRERQRAQTRSFLIAIGLFALTVVSTLAVGAQFAASYDAGQTPDFYSFFSTYATLLTTPQFLLAGLPYAFALLGILLAHELGHYFACRYYGISATYPYFIPAPTLIGTLGAFIRIRSPIYNRKALFDVGLAGPVVGFIFAIPALAIGILYSKVVPQADAHSSLIFGNPLALTLLVHLLRPGIAPGNLLLHPIGRAAWAGLFATALNLLPGGQLDGGHILYATASKYHRSVTIAVALALIPLGYQFWSGWYLWSGLLLVLGFRHPPLIYQWAPLGRARLLWAAVALAIFVVSFMPMPVAILGT